MAKIFNQQKRQLLDRQISNILYQLELTEAYAPVITRNLNEKKARRLENLKLWKEESLQEFELLTLADDEYIKAKTDDSIKRLEKKAYWQKRAQKAAFERKYTTANEQAQHQSELQESYKHIEKKQDEKMLFIKNKYSSRHLSDEQIKTNKKVYTDKLDELTKELAQFEQKSDLEIKNKLDKVIKKAEQKKLKLDKSYDQKSKKMEQLLNNLSNQLIVSNDVMDNQSILKIENLTMQFGGLKAVDNLTFEVKKGEVFGLIGPNGAGKTTVFNCITQFYKPAHGNIYYRNSVNDIILLNNFKVHNVIKQGIVRTFQNVELIWELSILDNMLVGAHSLYRSSFITHSFQTFGFRREEAILKAKAEKILLDLDLLIYKDFYPIGLPYGVLKKIELARTLMTNPSLIILDEPAAGLNDAETEVLAETIKKIQKDYNCTIFLVEHDMGLVMSICDTICAISFGKKLAMGTPQEIQSNKLVQEAYLGGE